MPLLVPTGLRRPTSTGFQAPNPLEPSSYDWLSTLVLVAVLLVGILLAYWIIRLAVRHGIRDADRRRPAPPASKD
ncbi:hypothetical protein GCM10023169_14250 [Georgenia halophila]|uniref:Uncharacterized protein n=1 Tax=Georgenia halophila TaxID=620889 RepID=A0ABP8L3F5_9MICO